MLSLESCREHCQLLDLIVSGKADTVIEALPQSDAAGVPETLQNVARDFASLLYSLLIQQMRKATDSEDEEGAVAEGAWDLLGMFMPRAVAGGSNDPLSSYVVNQLRGSNGGLVDEAA